MSSTPARPSLPHVGDRPDPPEAARSAADASVSDPAPPGGAVTGGAYGTHGTYDTKDLKGQSVRDLLTELAAVEARLRALPFLVTTGGSTGVNPEVARLLARQRAVVEQLRRRRVSWTASGTPRERSAAWPPPPWS